MRINNVVPAAWSSSRFPPELDGTRDRLRAARAIFEVWNCQQRLSVGNK